MKQDSRQLINEMKQILNKKQNKDIFALMNEGLVYGEENDEEIMNDPHGGQPKRLPNTGEQDIMSGDGKVNPLDEDPEITKLITGIRKQTLRGLDRLAEHPESAQYELLKKIFLLIDKAVEDKVDPEKQG